MSFITMQTYGAGVPLVLLHGWGFDSQVWSSILPDLLKTQAYQIHLIDLPGFGGTPTLSWEAFSSQVLKDLPDQFILIGWSLGGLFASRLAIEAPNRVIKLINITSSPFFIQTEDWAGIATAVLEDFYIRFSTAPELTRKSFIQSQLASQHPEPSLRHPEPSLRHPEPSLRHPERSEGALNTPINIAGLQEGLTILKHWDLRQDLKQLMMPVAYLFGRLDRIVSHKVVPHLQMLYPHFHYTIFRHSGHMPFLSHPKEFLVWLKEVAS